MSLHIERLATASATNLRESRRDLVEAAEAERISPLLYHGLRQRWPEFVSAGEHERLRRAYYRNAGRNVELLGALSDVTGAFRERGIDTLAFKGADLATSLYPNAALRPMDDVDLYVSPEDAERAEDALTEIGYRPWAPDMTPGLSRRVRHARLYVGGPKDSVYVDLHWSLVGHADDTRAPHRSWLERSARGFSAEPWRRLSPTAHLLYLAAHMKLQHYDEEIPLLWLVDFYLLATTSVIDWDELFGDAARFGWGDAVAATANDVRGRLGVTLPPELERVAASPRVPLHRPGARAEPERVWNELRTLSWRGRLSLARGYLFPSASYIRFRYPARPSWSWPLGYAKRWYGLAARGAAIVRKARRTELGVRPLLASRHPPTAQL